MNNEDNRINVRVDMATPAGTQPTPQSKPPQQKPSNAEDKDAPAVDNEELAERVLAALKGIYDPEIPVNIYDLGLIYDVIISDHQEVYVEMTLTTPGCPVAQTFPGQIEYTIRSVPGVADARVEVVWDPPWTKDRMSEEALLELGLF